MIDALIGWIGELAASVRERYAVDPYVFLALSAVCAPPFYYALYRLARALRNDRRAVARWSLLFLAATVIPYLYVLVFGRNLPWWVYGVLAVAVGMSVQQLAGKLRAGRSRTPPDQPSPEKPSPEKPASERSVATRISGAALSIGAITVVIKLVSLGSTILVASFFGTSDDMDAYLIAFLIPQLCITVICGAFSSALIPTYVQVRQQHGDGQAQELFSRVMFFAVVLLLVVAGCFALLLPYVLPVLASNFHADKLALAKLLSYFLIPAIVIKGVSVIYGSVLNADERFSLVAAAPALVPLATIAFLLLWPAPATRIYALAIGATVGMFGELVVLGAALKGRGMALLPHRRKSSAASRQVVAQYVPMAAGALMMSATTVVDRAMAAALPAGSVASLGYGERFVSVILQVVSGAIATAVLPFFSKLSDDRNWTELRSVLRVYSRWILLSTAVAAGSLVILSEALIGFVLERGTFSGGDTVLVGRIQAVYALQIPFYVCGMMFVRVISSLKANQILLVGSFLNLTINVALNYLFMRIWGVVGIALSTVCVYLFSCVFVMLMGYRILHRTQRGGLPEPGARRQ